MGRLSLSWSFLIAVVMLGCLVGGPVGVRAEPNQTRAGSQPAEQSQSERMFANLTLGGRQFWSDHLVFHDIRIQQHVHTGHYRLLDEADRRHCSGSLEACQTALERLKQELSLPPLDRRAVIVLHGLGRSRKSMQGLVEFLRENSELTVLNVSYASTRSRIEQHAEVLARVVANLPEVAELHFVGHSMGNLVIRHYLGDLIAADDRHAHQRLGRVGRIVMIAPPNQGASLAERFQRNPLFRVFWGISGAQIADWESLHQRLATPPGEFGILAGGKGNTIGHNPLIEGDDDFVVSVAETRLAGASDFHVVPTVHAIVMDHATTRAATLRFLQAGYFTSEDTKQPITD